MVHQKISQRFCMVKKLFFYITFITFVTIFLFVIALFFLEHKYSGEILKDIYNSKYDDEYKANYKYASLIVNMIKNKKKQLAHNYENVKKEQLLSYINSINSFTINIKNREQISDYLSNIPVKIKIADENYSVVASNDVLSIAQKTILPCNPLNLGYGICNKKKNNTLYSVMYSYKFNYFIIGEANVDPWQSSKIKKTLYNYIKIIPNIIIYQNKKDLSNFTSDNFYILKYENFTDLFYGIKINSSKIEKFANNIIKRIKKYENFLSYEMLILLGTLGLITLLFYWFFYRKIKTADRLYTEYSLGAKIDKLTGVYNRYGFEEELKISSFLRFCLLDLDNFKYINDTFGHDVGDKVLKKFISYLQEDFKNNTIGRWGGDEFMLLTSYTKDEIKDNLKNINDKLSKFQKSFDKYMQKQLSLSIGSVLFEEHQDFEDLFKKADLALYKVKKSLKGSITFYEEIEYIRIEKEDL